MVIPVCVLILILAMFCKLFALKMKYLPGEVALYGKLEVQFLIPNASPDLAGFNLANKSFPERD